MYDVAVRLLNVLFVVSAALLLLWLVLTGWDYASVRYVAGERGVRAISTTLFVTLALSSGLLLACRRRSNTYVDPETQWTMAEVGYALAFFFALFYGMYSVTSLYFMP